MSAQQTSWTSPWAKGWAYKGIRVGLHPPRGRRAWSPIPMIARYLRSYGILPWGGVNSAGKVIHRNLSVEVTWKKDADGREHSMGKAERWERIWCAQEMARSPKFLEKGLKSQMPAGPGQFSQWRTWALDDWYHQSEDIELSTHVKVKEVATRCSVLTTRAV